MSPIKNQGHYCGACYAFTTTADIESSYLIKNGKLYDLSEQQIIDCSSSFGNGGCDYGFYRYSLNYVIRNGITLEQYYPYIDKSSNCKTKITNTVSVQSFFAYNGNSCTILESTLKKRPVMVSIDALNPYWQFYSSGILSKCGNTLNHAVQVIGYSSFSNGTTFYLVKNSWGSSWGEGGKIRIDRKA